MIARFPPYLDSLKQISVVAPAGVVDATDLLAGTERLDQMWPLRMEADICVQTGYLAGDDSRRLRELQEAMDDPLVGAIIAARGGFGTTRILDALVFDVLKETPKWVVGCSDLTALLVHLWATARLVSIHGPMVTGFHKTAEVDLQALFRLLNGNIPDFIKTPIQPLIPGKAKGPLIGGNLTVLAHLMGTMDLSCFDDAVLFLEDVGEPPYRLERALLQLSRAGLLERVSGFVLGEFTRCALPEGQTIPFEAVMRVLGPLEKPAATGYPAAHGHRNAPFLHGATVELSVLKDRVNIGYYF